MEVGALFPRVGVDDAVAPADLARAPGLPRPQAGLRRLRASAALCPSYGEGPTDAAAARKLVKAGPFS